MTEQIIKETKKWLSDFIIQHNICPFAKPEFNNGSILYDVCKNDKLEDILQSLIQACIQLDENEEIETTLIIYKHGFKEFDEYLDLLEISNALMRKQGYEGVYQLASFHPHYCFEGVDEEDASNYTNRSPYPMLHIIREISLERALKHYPHPENIPTRNIEYTRELGIDYLRGVLLNCYEN